MSTLLSCWTAARRALTLGVWLLAAMPCTASAQAPEALRLRIVGGLAGLNQYTALEEPFWSQQLKRLSDGKYSADIVPFDRAGVPGTEMLRLLQLGVVPFGTALLSAIATRHPHLHAADLAGQNLDMPSLKRSVAAFRPYLEKTLREQHGVEALALYVYPAQVVFCRRPMRALSDLAGRRVRVASTTQSDFVSALGGVPVLSGFAQIMGNMASGNTDCAITGTMSGNTLGLHEVTSHIHTLPLTWGLAVFAANAPAWEALPPDLKALLRRELPKLEAAVWLQSEAETAQGLACNRGVGVCPGGRSGRMVEVTASPQDLALAQAVFRSTVLANWLQRCGVRCTQVWQDTMAPARPKPGPTTP